MYANVTYADDYLLAQAFSDGWAALTNEAKAKFLAKSTKMIQQFCVFYDESGVPFTYDVEENNELPDWLKDATCEQALYLVNLGKDPTQADKKTTLGIISTKGTTFDKRFKADLLCINAQQLITRNGGEVLSAGFGQGKAVK